MKWPNPFRRLKQNPKEKEAPKLFEVRLDKNTALEFRQKLVKHPDDLGENILLGLAVRTEKGVQPIESLVDIKDFPRFRQDKRFGYDWRANNVHVDSRFGARADQHYLAHLCHELAHSKRLESVGPVTAYGEEQEKLRESKDVGDAKKVLDEEKAVWELSWEIFKTFKERAGLPDTFLFPNIDEYREWVETQGVKTYKDKIASLEVRKTFDSDELKKFFPKLFD